jgi:uncharacterized protein (DUF362 family)
MISRRDLLAAAAALAASPLGAQAPAARRSTVSLVKGENRRRNISEALAALDREVRPLLRRKKYVVIKPNNVSTTRQLAATHADTLHGILDWLGPRFKGPVYIAESSAGDTMTGFTNFKYDDVARQRSSQKVTLVDLNEEGRYEILHVLNADLHPAPVRLATRLLDEDAFIISSAILKTHNVVVATLGIKNMTLGAPLHQAPKETPRWNDKRQYHGGVRQTHFDIYLTAQRMARAWSLSVIDGYEGMEGNGPSGGTPVPSRCAIASTDFVAADRVGLEAMSVNPEWPGYLRFCAQAGLGVYDPDRIDVIGNKLDDVKLVYKLHNDIDRQLQWMGPIKELPVKLG